MDSAARMDGERDAKLDAMAANVYRLGDKAGNGSKSVPDLEADIQKLREERSKHGYELAFTPAERKRLAEAPEGWFPTLSSVRVQVEGGVVEDVQFELAWAIGLVILVSTSITGLASRVRRRDRRAAAA